MSADAGSRIDVNVSWGRWPFRRLPGDDPAGLARRLDRHRVESAWVGSLDGLFHRDLREVNRRLVEETRQADAARLRPFGAVNPLLPDWQEDLRICHERHQMLGVRLHPGPHGYGLDRPEAAELLAAIARRGLVCQIVGSMEDERTQSPAGRAPHVDFRPLIDLLPKLPDLRLTLLNSQRNTPLDLAVRLTQAGRAAFDIAMLEGAAGVEKWVERLPADRLLFGSHFPLFYYESAVLKLHESRLEPALLARVVRDNARALAS